MNTVSASSPSWFFLNEDDMLVPLKIDISCKGARYVDSFCWNCNPETNTMSAYEFSCRTCADVGLPDGFQWKIAMQIQEQIDAYRILIDILRNHGSELLSRLNPLQPISLAFRHLTVDYSDKFLFDCTSAPFAPEHFARVTVLNLGLPGELEPAIAHNIRENVFRQLFFCLEQASKDHIECHNPVLTPSEITVSLVAPNQAVDMVTNLWRRARPKNFDDLQSTPQPRLPSATDTNAHVWHTLV